MKRKRKRRHATEITLIRRNNMFGHGLYGFGGPFAMVIFWAALIAGLVYLVQIIRREKPYGAGVREPSPLEVLRRRYAAGELDRDEYERIKRDLSVQ
jgi:putative membrane protein